MKIFASIFAIANKVKGDNLSAFAAKAALFIIMSFIPCVILLMLLVKYTPLTEEMVISAANQVIPAVFAPTISSFVHEVYKDVSNTAILVAIVAVLWVSGKGFYSLIEGLNSVFEIKEHRNWIVLRLYSTLYTVIFLVIIALCVVIYVLGGNIKDYFLHRAPMVYNIIDRILQFRVLIVMVLLTLLFTFLYVAIPNRHTKIRRQFPGALFSALGWSGFSFFFSLYIKYSKSLSTLYGSLTTIICIMLWLYVCMNIFLTGAEVNLYVEQWKSHSAIDKATDVEHKN